MRSALNCRYQQGSPGSIAGVAHRSEDNPDLEVILGSWGVLIGALPQGFSELAPSGTGDGEFYMCDAYNDNTKGLSFDFWKISGFGSPGGGGGGRRRSTKGDGLEHDDDDDDEEEAAAEGVGVVQQSLSDTLFAGTATPQPEGLQSSQRRQLYRGYGGGNGLSVCLPSDCNANDVKIISGYYYFWMKCGAQMDSGVAALNSCGAKLCPRRITNQAATAAALDGAPDWARAAKAPTVSAPGGCNATLTAKCAKATGRECVRCITEAVTTPPDLACLNEAGITAVAGFCAEHGAKGLPTPPSNDCSDLFVTKCKPTLNTSAAACATCVAGATAGVAAKAKCTNGPGIEAVAGYCASDGRAPSPPAPPGPGPRPGPPPPGPPGPAFDPLDCYYDVCHSSYGVDDFEATGLHAELLSSGGDGLRRQLQHHGGGGGGSCPEKHESIELDELGTFWVGYIILTMVTIAVASSPYPFGLAGLLDKVKAAAAKPMSSLDVHSIQGAAAAAPLGGAPDTDMPPACARHPVMTKLLEIAYCWNIQRNFKSLCKKDPGIEGMGVLNGMRVMAIMAIVLGHTFAFMQEHTTNYGLTGIVANRESVIGIIGNHHVQENGTSIAFLSVDTFFFFSGFLAFYSMLTSILSQEMNGAKDFAIKSIKWSWAVFIHRYMRLTPMYFFLLMFFTHIFPAIGDGPNWKEGIESGGPTGGVTFCKKYWWTNILYISNLYPCQFWNHHDPSNPVNDWGGDKCDNGSGELGCMIQTWYLSNDYQMFMVAIPCAILFKWKIAAAYAYLAALMAGSLGYSTYLMTHFYSTFCDMNICSGGYGGRRMLYKGGGGGGYGYSSLCDSSDPTCSPTFCDSPNKADVQVMYYDKPWTRFPPYGIGMLLALLLVHLRREPDTAAGKKSVSTTVFKPAKFHSNGVPDVSNATARPRPLPVPVLLVTWVGALVLLWYCAYGTYYAIPDAATPHTCPWGGDWAPPAYELPDGGCNTYLYDRSPCSSSSGIAACEACVHKENNHSSFTAAGCTAAKGEAWCAEDNEPDAGTDYGSRTHSFHDLFFSVTFRMWWAVGVAFIVWASMAEQGGPIGAFLGSSMWCVAAPFHSC